VQVTSLNRGVFCVRVLFGPNGVEEGDQMRGRLLTAVGVTVAAIVIGVGSWQLAADHSQIGALRLEMRSSGAGHEQFVLSSLLTEAHYVRKLQIQVAAEQVSIQALEADAGAGTGQGANGYALAQGLNSEVATLQDTVQNLDYFMGCMQRSEIDSWGSFNC